MSQSLPKNQEPLSMMCEHAIAQAGIMGHRTVRPEHALLALAVTETESFFSSQLTEFEKAALTSYVASTDSRVPAEPIMDKLLCALHRCLRVGIPPYSRAFFTVMHTARKRSETMKRQDITSRDLCFALLLELPENAVAHEALKRAGRDAHVLKLALESNGPA